MRLDPLSKGYVGSRNGAPNRWGQDRLSSSHGSLKSRLCVDFVKIMCRFRPGAQIEIICQFCRDCVLISPRICWSSALIWKIFTEVENVEIVFFNLYDRTSVDRAIYRHAQGLNRSTDRSIEDDREERNPFGGRLTNPVSPAILQNFVRSTAHLGRSTSRSTNSQFRHDSGPELLWIWGFLLLSINREINPFLGLWEKSEFLGEPIVNPLVILCKLNINLSLLPQGRKQYCRAS